MIIGAITGLVSGLTTKLTNNYISKKEDERERENIKLNAQLELKKAKELAEIQNKYKLSELNAKQDINKIEKDIKETEFYNNQIDLRTKLLNNKSNNKFINNWNAIIRPFIATISALIFGFVAIKYASFLFSNITNFEDMQNSINIFFSGFIGKIIMEVISFYYVSRAITKNK